MKSYQLWYIKYHNPNLVSASCIETKMRLHKVFEPILSSKKKDYFFFVTTLISSGSGLGPETLVLEVISAVVTVERLRTIHEIRVL